MTPLTVLVVIAVIILIGVGIYYGHLQEKKRREAMALFAQQLGWHFHPAKEDLFSLQYEQFDHFKRGHSRYAHNLIYGDVHANVAEENPMDIPTRAGDYHYMITRSDGKRTTTTTYRFSFLILDLPDGVNGDLLIRTENIGDKIKAGLGFDDIDFESAEFSDRFYVKSRDKRFAYDVINPRMMQFLLDTNPPMLMLDRGALCLASNNRRWEPKEFQSHIDWVKHFFAYWPRHLNFN